MPIRAPASSCRRACALSLGARLTIVRQEGDFAVSEDGLHLWSRHLADAHSREPDTVAVAERFLETPYLWGGRTSEGIDCSGLVQTALTAAGVAAPRDSDMMEAGLGRRIAIDDQETLLARGDLVFWKGHVGIMRDSVTLIHANGWHMKVVSEPLVEARDRIAANGGGHVTSVRRFGAVARRARPEPVSRGRATAARPTRLQPYFLPATPRPAKRLLKRDNRPPRSTSCWEPPVQAGCVLGSMSSCSVEPSSP